MVRFTVVFALATAFPGWAQFGYPASASTTLNFAQLADGGPAAQKWITRITFTNPNTTVAASVRVSFYGDGGQPRPLDFGQGASAALNLTVPAGGVKSVSTTGASATMVWGWGIATSNSPVTGVVLYRATGNGKPLWDVAAVGTGSCFYYNSYANANLGVALANPNSKPVHLRVAARRRGSPAASRSNRPTGFAYDGNLQRTDFIAGLSLVIDADTTNKATYVTADNGIHLSAALVETLGDSDAALAFLVGHTAFRGMCKEYDLPNGMVARLQPIWAEISHHCSVPDALWAYTSYATVHKYWHPHYPASIP